MDILIIQWNCKNIQSPEEYIKWSHWEKHPFIREQVERQKLWKIKWECCTFYNVFCPMSYLRLVHPVDETYKRKSEAVKYAFSIVADAAELSRQLIEEAGWWIYYCVQMQKNL